MGKRKLWSDFIDVVASIHIPIDEVWLVKAWKLMF